MQNLNTKIVLSVLTLMIFYAGCSNKEKRKRIKIKDYYVEANFINNQIADGKAYYYDSIGKLKNISSYEKGLKHGVSVNYYPNGNVSDSVSYWYGKEFGYSRHYDLDKKIKYMNYYYFGVQYGPEYYYKNNKLKLYQFSDFNRVVLTECNYDSLGKLQDFEHLLMQLILRNNTNGTKSLFAYLPNIPITRQIFSIGITNKSREDKPLFEVTSNNYFVDTLLPAPPLGFYYYISCDIRSKNDSLKKFFIEEFRRN